MTEEIPIIEETKAVVSVEPGSVGKSAGAGEVVSARPRSEGGRRVAVVVVKGAQSQMERASQAASTAKGALGQIGKAIDPREVAGGFAGLTAGEAVGGAAGGAAGAAVAGPPGAVVGAQVGAFTAGMLGLKLGVEAVQDLKEAAEERNELAESEQPAKPPRGHRSRLLGTRLKDRVGEIVGLTSGATVGLVVAGPVGGLVGAVVGETIGGRVKGGRGKTPSKNAAADQLAEAIDPADPTDLDQSTDLADPVEPAVAIQAAAPVNPDEPEGVTGWLERFGKNTTGEAATVLFTGTVGALFGPTGMNVGHGVGRVVSRRVEWHKLGKSADDAQPAVSQLPAGSEPQIDSDAAPGPDQALLAAPDDGDA